MLRPEAKRLKMIADYFKQSLGLSANEFGARIGLSSGLLSQILTGKTKTFGADKLLRIIEVFPEINSLWLLTGEGAMLNAQLNAQLKTAPPTQESEKYSDEAEALAAMEKKTALYASEPHIIEVQPGEHMDVPVVEQRAAAGALAGISAPGERLDYLPTIPVNRRQFGKGTYVAVTAYGESMHATIRHGDYLISKYIQEREFLIPNYVYVIVTLSDGALVKRVVRHGDTFTLLSDNPAYGPIYLPASEALQFWQVEATLSYNLGNANTGALSQIAELADRMAAIERAVFQDSNLPRVRQKKEK